MKEWKVKRETLLTVLTSPLIKLAGHDFAQVGTRQTIKHDAYNTLLLVLLILFFFDLFFVFK